MSFIFAALTGDCLFYGFFVCFVFRLCLYKWRKGAFLLSESYAKESGRGLFQGRMLWACGYFSLVCGGDGWKEWMEVYGVDW